MRIYHLDMKIVMFKESWLRSWFRRLAAAGYDAILVEIDNKLVFPSHPDFAAPDALSADRWRSLARYAKRLGMEFYPLIQTLGHMEHVLHGHSAYRHLAEIPGGSYLMCPSKPETFAFIRDLIDDIYEVFDHPARIHLGGDETRGAGTCPHCANRPVPELLSGYLHQLAAHALKKGMRPEFWADMMLAHPETLSGLTKEARLVDWLYFRDDRLSTRKFFAFGFNCHEHPERTPQQHLQHLPESMTPLKPYLVDARGRFDPFHGAKFLKDRGYDLVLGSAVRFAGDTYYLPRTRTNLRNVGATERVARSLGADHLVTSWAVRLSHPETTWPGLLAEGRRGTDELKTCGRPIGGLDGPLLKQLDLAQTVIPGIDNTLEPQMRFQRPFYGDWLQHILKLRDAPGSAALARKIGQRAEVCDALRQLFAKRLQQGQGDETVLRHWLDGLETGSLRAAQTAVLLEIYRGRQPVSALKPFIARNRDQMKRFRQLWRQSLTPHSLDQELEIKFRRDIRCLEELLG